MYPEKIHICAGERESFFSFPYWELPGEALKPRAAHTDCGAVCNPMCKFTYTFLPSAYYSDNNEPSPFPHLNTWLAVLQCLPTRVLMAFQNWLFLPNSENLCSSQGQTLLVLPPWRTRWAAVVWRMGSLSSATPLKSSCWGAEAARSLFLPSFPPPCRRQPCLPRCWAAVTGSPRCSLLWTLFFLAQRSPRHLKTEKRLKALLASFLASAPPFLSRNSLWIK